MVERSIAPGIIGLCCDEKPHISENSDGFLRPLIMMRECNGSDAFHVNVGKPMLIHPSEQEIQTRKVVNSLAKFSLPAKFIERIYCRFWQMNCESITLRVVLIRRCNSMYGTRPLIILSGSSRILLGSFWKCSFDREKDIPGFPLQMYG